MLKKKESSFQTLKIQKFNCFFSQICEVSHSQLQNRDINKQQIMNSFIGYEQSQLFIMTKGGTKFHIPMDQQVSRVFPMVEGVLIQFYIKPQIRFHQILYYQNNKNAMQIQIPQDSINYKKPQGRYSYATLTRHPLNPLKILGQLKNQDIIPLLKTQQQIVTVSQSLPLIVTYNTELKRNAFHVLIANMSEIKQQYQYAFIPSHSYSLSNLTQSSHYEVLSLALHEQSISGAMIRKIIINKSIKRGHIYLYVLTEQNQLKIYQISFFGTSNNSTKLIKTIKNVNDIIDASLYNTLAFDPKFFQGQNQVQLIFSILYEQINKLNDCVCIIQQKDKLISTYHNGHFVKNIKYDQNYQNLLKNQSEIIKDSFDSLILKSLQMSLLDDVFYAFILSKYCNGNQLNNVILDVIHQKRQIFYYLHLIFQEFKLYQFMKQQRAKLGPLMVKIAQKSGKKQYLDYYARQGFMIEDQTIKQSYSALQIDQVYDIFDLVQKILFKKPLINQTIYCIYNRSRFMIRFFQILIKGRQQVTIQRCSRQNLPLSAYQHGNEYLYKIRYPLLSQKVFHINYFNKVYENKLLKNAKPQNKQQSAFIYLIKHNQSQDSIDTYPLAIRAVFNWLLRQMRKNLPFSLYEQIPELGFNLIKRQDLYKNILLYRKKNINVPYHLQKPSFDDHIKTLIHTSTSQQYFLTSNASQMNKTNNDLVFEQVDRLLSSTSQIKIKVKDIESIPQQKWEVQSQNILLKFANRKLAVIIGQGAFSLATSMSFITDIIKIPKINLNGIMPNDIKIALDLKDDKQSIIYWPEFHAGMVAGLKLSRHVIPLSEDHLKTWIFYQKPDTPKRDHAGFLLSLGLQGYLKCFSPTDIYQYLKPNNQFTSVAILLGISASNISNSDQSLTKALFLHIPALLPPSIDVQIPINVQTSALIGLGLLHKGSCNRTMTQTALSQIGKLPRSDKCLQREGYSLAAGWALGMICLGMRDKKQTFRDLQLEQRLIRFIQGGKVMEPPQSITSTFHINQNKTSSVKQGPNVNLHVTAPASLLAISLMYLKSNNTQLASKITIPNSFSTIQQCNPNHILLKTMAKNLIMWQNIGNTSQFVISQVPQIIKFIYDSSLNKVYQRYYLVYNVPQIDYQTVTSIYVNVTTGAILSMALKYAGSGNVNVVSTIKKHIDHLKMIRIIKCQFANDPMNKNCIDQYQLFSLLSCSILSLAIVMAGTCDIQCLKLIRIIRKKFQDTKVFHYGFSMAINMAIGFLFLGYGNYTFNRSDMSVAALLISIFPQFPNSPSDNRWHLQALRHFYVLAMQEKIFHAVDVDTNKVVNAYTQMEFEIQNKIYSETMQTPVLLQENKKLIQIKIRDPDYFDVDFSFKDTKGQIKAIYIKRKYFKDINPKLLNPQNPLITQTIQKKAKQALNEQVRYRSIFLKNQQNPQNNNLSLKLGYLIKNSNQKNFKSITDKINSQKPIISKDLYYRLLKQDRLQMIEVYLNLKQQLRQLLIKSKSQNSSLLISNIALLLNFQKFLGNNQFKNLIQDELELLKSKILSENQEMLRKYFNNPHEIKLPREFYRLLGLFRIPQSKDLILSMEVIKKMKQLPNKQSLQMLFYMSHPQSSFEYLNLVSESMYIALKN